MPVAIFKIETLGCSSCVPAIEHAIEALEGVDKHGVDVLLNADKVQVAFDDDVLSVNRIEETIDRLGFSVLKTRVK